MARADALHIRNVQRTVAGCFVLVAIFGALCVSVARRPDSDGYVGLVVIGLIMAIAAVRIVRAGAIFDSDGVVVRNWVRSRRVPWSQVAGFSPAMDDDRHHTVGVALVDGGRISCFALGNIGGPANLIDGKLGLTDANAAVDQFAEAIERQVGRRAHMRPATTPVTDAALGETSRLI